LTYDHTQTQLRLACISQRRPLLAKKIDMQHLMPMTDAIVDLKRLIDDLDWDRKDTTGLRQQLTDMQSDTSEWYPLF
jgi:hypothetical protein